MEMVLEFLRDVLSQPALLIDKRLREPHGGAYREV